LSFGDVPDPKAPKTPEEIQKDMASAMEETLSKFTVDALMNVKPEDLVSANPEAEVVKGTALKSCGYLHSPAMFELLAVADRRFTKVGNLAGIPGKKMERADARWIKGTKLIVIKAAPGTDLSATPVNRYTGSSSAWINLVSLLAELGLTVETGYREKYDVAFVPKGSPLWPGLVIDLGKSQGRSLEAKKKGE